MLTALLAIIDRLIELIKVRQTHRSNFFQKIVEPSFTDLLMIENPKKTPTAIENTTAAITARAEIKMCQPSTLVMVMDKTTPNRIR